MVIYKDIFEKLKVAGYTTYRLQKEHLMAHATMTKIKNGGPINTTTIDTICRLLNCQPGEILEYVPDGTEE